MGNTYSIVIHRQRNTKSLFIIFGVATRATGAVAAATVVVVVVAAISIGYVCRRQNGVCMPTINVIHIGWWYNMKGAMQTSTINYFFFFATTLPYSHSSLCVFHYNFFSSIITTASLLFMRRTYVFIHIDVEHWRMRATETMNTRKIVARNHLI